MSDREDTYWDRIDAANDDYVTTHDIDSWHQETWDAAAEYNASNDDDE